uniref:IncH1 plasmid conjugative transfer protein Orf9 n=1 Tax=Klebsiella pneumoniae TaxID=573 RepID=A0A8B0STK3_KLEPN|nr:IncH1 plasmid conjugative transfer protein Orf9 [Klebsiella pneumoniae]
MQKSVPANVVLTTKVEGQDAETKTYKNKSGGDTPVTYSERIKKYLQRHCGRKRM